MQTPKIVRELNEISSTMAFNISYRKPPKLALISGTVKKKLMVMNCRLWPLVDLQSLALEQRSTYVI